MSFNHKIKGNHFIPLSGHVHSSSQILFAWHWRLSLLSNSVLEEPQTSVRHGMTGAASEDLSKIVREKNITIHKNHTLLLFIHYIWILLVHLLLCNINIYKLPR